MSDVAFDRLRSRRDFPIRYRYCLPFDVLATHIDSDLTNFVCTLFLNSSAGAGNADITHIFDEIGAWANAHKIAITSDSGGYLQCPIEIERWDLANEKSVLHFKSPAIIPSAANTRYYFWYDHSVVDNSVYVGDVGDVVGAKVWDDDYYRMVQHLWAVGAIDSTRRNNGTVHGSPTLQDGQVGKCLEFDGLDDYIQFPHADDNDLDFKPDEDEFTISAWAKRAGVLASVIIAKRAAAGDKQYVMRFMADGDAEVFVGNAWQNVAEAHFADNEWHQMVLRNYLVGATMKYRIYIDGEPVGSEGNSGSGTNSMDTLIGAQRNANNTDHKEVMEGRIDEVRISACDRGVAGIKAGFHSQNDTLVNWIV